MRRTANVVVPLSVSFSNSRTAIAGAIIGLLLVFYNSKNLNCFGVVFLRLEEEYWRSPFFNQFYWSGF